MRNCVDEGTLQALIDGELPADQAAQVSSHLAACAACGDAARAIEAEHLILSEGLALEFEQAVPSERLRNRLDAALAAQHVAAAQPGRNWLSAIRDFLPSFGTLAYASAAAAVILAVTVAFVYFKKAATPTNEVVRGPVEVAPAPNHESAPPQQVRTSEPKNVIVKNLPAPVRKAVAKKAPEPDSTSLAWQERQYQQAIAKLSDAMKTQSPLRPSLLVEYEYNMALIDTAIATTRDAAKKNPKDPQAAQFVLSAYQSKVDLMNQIAEARTTDR